MFALKIHWRTYSMMSQRFGFDFGMLPQPIRWVHLERADVVAQSVSFVKAQQTGVFGVRGPASTANSSYPTYDDDVLVGAYVKMMAGREGWRTFFSDCGADTISVGYEEFRDNYAATVNRVAASLGWPLDRVPSRARRRSMARTASTLGSAGILAAGGTAALLAALAGSAGASATIVVDSSADGTADANHCTDGTPGNCTISDATAAAADGDIITFDAAITNITLTEGEIGTQAVSIVGPGSSALTITTAGVPGAYDMFRIGGTGDALISGLTLTKNRIKSLNTEKFTLDDVAITGSTGSYGGALYAGNDDLEIRNSHFEDNYAAKNGGAVHIYNGADATISDSEFVNN
jgi:hypothetical protein